MDPINKLTETFRRFPGIGPRQARRFVYFLLTQNNDYLEKLTQEIKNLKNNVKQCENCYRFFNNDNYQKNNTLCRICLDNERTTDTLIIVEKDVDLDAIERAGTFQGYYFVLGGNIPILDKNPEDRIRAKELLKIIEQRANAGLKEIIIATSATTEGDYTADFIKNYAKNIIQKFKIKISLLGRGLSTGSEVEYADSETIKSALENRHEEN